MTAPASLNIGDRVALPNGSHGTIVIASSATGDTTATATVEVWNGSHATHHRVPIDTLAPVYRLLDYVLVKGIRVRAGGYSGRGGYWVFDPDAGTRFDVDADRITPATIEES